MTDEKTAAPMPQTEDEWRQRLTPDHRLEVPDHHGVGVRADDAADHVPVVGE